MTSSDHQTAKVQSMIQYLQHYGMSLIVYFSYLIVLCLQKFVQLLFDEITFFNLQVPFYLGELTEKVAQDDRIQVLKISQDQLKVSLNFMHEVFMMTFC